MNISVESSLKQLKYCLAKNIKVIAPSNGKCPNCRQNIYTDHERLTGGISKGYTLEDAESTLITQCPHCMHLFERKE